MKHPQPAHVTDWHQEPLVVSFERVCDIYGWRPRGLRTRVLEGRFPPPFTTHPMRWYRSDLERAWSGQTIQKRRSA